MEAKRQLSSKTNWFALALVIASQVTELLKDEAVIAFLGNNIGWIGTVVGIAVFILRQYTKVGVSWGTDKQNLEVLNDHHQSDDDYTKDF